MDTFLQIIFITSFLIHAVLKNLVIGGIPILMLTYYRGRHGGVNDYYRSLARGMSLLAPATLSLAVVFGLVTWGLVSQQYEWTFIAWFGSSLGGWATLVVLLVLGFWGVVTMKREGQGESGVPWGTGMLVTGCMIMIAGMFVTSHIDLLTLSSSPETLSIGGYNDRSTLWPRFFHVIFSGIAITGMALTLFGSLRPQCHEDRVVEPAPYDIRLVRYGVGWVLGGTVPQVVVGPWFMLALPSDVRFYLVDGTSVASLIFFMSLTLTLLSLVLLNSSLLVPQKIGLVWGGVGSLVLTVVFMVLVREEVRKVWIIAQGQSVGVGELSWIVVLSVVAIMLGGLFVGGRYVTLSQKQREMGS